MNYVSMEFVRNGKKTGQVFDLNSAKLRLSMTLRRLVRSGEPIVQTSGFGLADQVLTHALFAAGADFKLQNAGIVKSAKSSLRDITQERYDLVVSGDPSDDKDALEISFADLGISRESLENWPVEALVQYALDHEVPVDPADMPGFFKDAA